MSESLDRAAAEGSQHGWGPYMAPSSPEISARQFDKISRLLRDTCGINLGQGKEHLVKARLWKRLRALGLPDFSAYLDLVESEEGVPELTAMIDSLTTNETSFFRERAHFEFLKSQLLGDLRGKSALRIWSAGCSTGEEPYSIAVSALEAWGDRAAAAVRILATDISTRTLKVAREAVYGPSKLAGVPLPQRERYFVRDGGSDADARRVAPEVRQLVRFAQLNLLDPWPMRGPFDMIFCRNVMIYFDPPTQRALLDRIHLLLRPGGFLFLGHAESLAGRNLGLQYVRPAVYRR